MHDIRGTTIREGDKVAFVDDGCPALGMIIGFTPKQVKIDFIYNDEHTDDEDDDDDYPNGYIVTRYPNKVLILK